MPLLTRPPWLCPAQAPDWMVLQNAGVALNCIDASFKQFLSDTLQSGLKDEDLKEPKSSTEVHQLFDGGRSSISVY